MKSTAERLSESYCRPRTVEDWIDLMGFDQSKHAEFCKYSQSLGAIPSDNTIGRTTEIAVQHFIDLLRDTIAPWRLAEDAKERGGDPRSWGIIYVNQHHIIEITKDMKVVLNGRPMKGITSYTELLTLIRLIG